MLHPIKTLIASADKAITTEDFDALMDFYAEDATLVIRPSVINTITRRATYVFNEYPDNKWLCVVDNSYGTDLLDNCQLT